MRLINSLNLPEPIVAAVANDPYSDGGSDISVTRLISAPQIVELSRRYNEQLSEDVADRLWATYGQIMHGLLERAVKDNAKMAERYLSEQRMFAQVNGWKISGQLDLYDKETSTLYDYKFVGSYAVKMAKKEGKLEWEQQLNLLRWLLYKEHAVVAKNIAIIGMVRDYSEKLQKEGVSPVSVIDFPVWDIVQAQEWVYDRVKIHQDARNKMDSELPPCTDSERWYNPRTGQFNRCRRYCPAVSVCHQASVPLFGTTIVNEIE